MITLSDNNENQKRLDHYNAWLKSVVDRNRLGKEVYPGFPADKEKETALEAYKQDFLQRKAEKIEKKSKMPVKTKKPVKTGSKLALAVEIFKKHAGEKDKVIQGIQEECGMSLAGATTYYYNAKKNV